MKYTFNVSNTRVYCVTKYLGKPVVGVAKCDTSVDKFNESVGVELSELRCEEKVAKKRVKRAELKVEEAKKKLFEAEKYFAEMQRYLSDAKERYDEVTIALSNLEESLK